MTRRPVVYTFDPSLIHHREPGVLGELEQLSSRALALVAQMERRIAEVFAPHRQA